MTCTRAEVLSCQGPVTLLPVPVPVDAHLVGVRAKLFQRGGPVASSI